MYFFGYNPTKVVDTNNGNSMRTFTGAIYGSFDSPLNKPMDVVKVNDLIFVTDTNNQRVQAFDTEYELKFSFGKKGYTKGEFMFPYGITTANNQIWVGDLYNKNISIFDMNGKFIKYFTPQGVTFEGPGGLRIENEKLYMTDLTANKVYVFDLNGKKLLEIKGAFDGLELSAPNFVITDGKDIFVSDSANNRVLKFDSKGNFMLPLNGTKDNSGQAAFINPRGMAVNKDTGTLYIVDKLSHRIHGYDTKGKQKFIFGSFGADNENFILANSIFIDTDGTLYITDTGNNRVTVY
jgi:DNA-binding beta-propeller fold protein YncE